MPRAQQYTDEALLDALRRFQREQGESPRVQDFGQGRTPGMPSAATIIARFGSWANAVETAGMPRPRRGRRPKR
jgi:hypothetical protein